MPLRRLKPDEPLRAISAWSIPACLPKVDGRCGNCGVTASVMTRQPDTVNVLGIPDAISEDPAVAMLADLEGEGQYLLALVG